jgi:DNA-binding transcriptional ArsR family regulator
MSRHIGVLLNHMVEHTTTALDRTFQALADPTRRAMLGALARGACSVGQLASPHAMSLAAASKHVKVLEAAGLLRREVRGREHMCHLSARPLANAHDFLASYAEFWAARLDALEALLNEQTHESIAPRVVPKPDRRKSTGAARTQRKGRSRHVRQP